MLWHTADNLMEATAKEQVATPSSSDHSHSRHSKSQQIVELLKKQQQLPGGLQQLRHDRPLLLQQIRSIPRLRQQLEVQPSLQQLLEYHQADHPGSTTKPLGQVAGRLTQTQDQSAAGLRGGYMGLSLAHPNEKCIY